MAKLRILFSKIILRILNVYKSFSKKASSLEFCLSAVGLLWKFNQNPKLRWYSWFIAIFVCFGSAARFAATLYCQSVKCSIHSFNYRSLSRNPQLVIFLNMIIAIATCYRAVLFNWANYDDNAGIIWDIVRLDDQVREKYGLSVQLLKKVKKRSRIGSFFCVFFAVEIVILVTLRSIIIRVLRLGIHRFLSVFNVLILIQILFSGIYTVSIICLPFVMFYTTCFMFKMKFQEITKDVENILEEPYLIHVSRVREILVDYAATCRFVEKYNHFWCKFLGFDYFVWILLTSSVLLWSYIEKNSFGISTSINTLFIIISMLAFLAYSGDIVTRSVHSPYRALNKLALLELPKKLKLQVSQRLIKLCFC
jgi:hypothetical protein